jgi:hypothetical protein
MIKIQDSDLYLTNLRTRMPFKYGIATMTHMPMIFVRVRLEIDGKVHTGVASDLLPPKWFTKDPLKSAADEIQEMFDVIDEARVSAIGLRGEDVFTIWRQLYHLREMTAEACDIPPLLVHFGTSLIERAMIEAFCRASEKSFGQLVHSGGLGIRLGDIHPELAGVQPSDVLPKNPLQQFVARHTVGLADPLTDEEIPASDRLADGLPQSLEACIRHYGLRHFKIKVNGNLDSDLERLRRIAETISATTTGDFAFSLDGNEQFKTLADFRVFWEAVQAREPLRNFLERLIFVEQPLLRSVALDPAVKDAFSNWPNHPPIIIDESDASLESLPTALELGYAGTSHKNCKGVFKGIINRCLLLHRAAADKQSPLLMSGEDLCNIGPVALLQDLAVAATLGIESIERNGHHYCAGLSMFPESAQSEILACHGDLYQPSESGWPTLKIVDGKCDIGSLNQAPFGVGFELDIEAFTPAADWAPEIVEQP